MATTHRWRVRDRGPVKYFTCRTDVLDFFANLCKRAKSMKGGTNLLVQGSPGAGKAALLYQCGLEAEKERWGVAKIGARSLCGPELMTRDLRNSYTARTEHVASL